MLLQRLRQLGGESLIYGLSSIIGRFLSIWLTPIYTRLLTPADYGALSLITASIALVQGFAALALDTAAGRWFYDAKNEEDRRRPFASWFWTHLTVSVLAATAILIWAPEIGRWIGDDPALAPYLRLVAGTLPLSVASSVALTWLRMQRKAWTTVSFVTGQTVLQIVLTFVLVVWLRKGLAGIYIAQLATGVVALFGSVVLAGAVMRLRYFDARLLRTMLAYALPLIPASIAMWVVGSVDRFFVQRFVSTAEVGIFSIATSIASLLTIIVWAFQQAWSPFALSMYEEPDAKRTFGTVFLVYCAGGAFAVTGLSLFSPVAIRIFATPAYDRASHVVGLMAMSYVLAGASSIVAIGYAIAKTSRPTAAAVGIGAALTIALNALLVPRFGMIGSAIATVIGQGAQPLFLIARAPRSYHVPFPVARGGAILLWALVVSLGAEALLAPGITPTSLLVRLLLLGTVAGAALVFRIVTVDHLRRLLARVSRGNAAPA